MAKNFLNLIINLMIAAKKKSDSNKNKNFQEKNCKKNQLETWIHKKIRKYAAKPELNHIDDN